MKRYDWVLHLLICCTVLLGFASPLPAHNKATKVCYSLPGDGNFNISLSHGDVDAVTEMTGPDGVRKVVLDAGHGGKDGGCAGKHSLEKDIALDITLRLGQLIKRYHPDVEVIYTRNKDEFIPLHKRAEIANSNKADLFISIHCNTTAKKNSAIGTETFVMGLHRADDNLIVAKRENAAIAHEENFLEKYDGYDPNSAEAHITLSMYQNAFLDQSIKLANLIEDEFKTHGQRVSRGVKQAGFLVLRNTVMPSVLIEAGFLNHSKEEVILTSEEGKDRAAASIFNAFTKYKYDMDKEVVREAVKPEAVAVSHTAEVQPPAEINMPVEINKKEIKKQSAKIEPEPINYVERAKREMAKMKADKMATAKKDQSPNVATNTGKSEKSSRNYTTSSSVDKENLGKKPPVTKTKPVAVTNTKKKEPSSAASRDAKRLEFLVQLSASTAKLKTGEGKWNQVENVMIRYENNFYKYQIGGGGSYDKAAKLKNKLRTMGFSDCFVVAYYDDKPIAIKDAIALSH